MTRFRLLSAVVATVAIVMSPQVLAEETAPIEWLVVLQGEVTDAAPTRMSVAASPTAIAFADRPSHLVRIIDLGRFLAIPWADEEPAADPPNASVVDETAGDLAVIEINGMTLVDGLLTVDFALLEGRIPASGDRIAVTIDAFPTSVNSQMTDIVMPD